MIEQWQPSLNKQIHCNMAKLKVASQYFVNLYPFTSILPYFCQTHFYS